jgi:hypothetical protein
MSIQDGTKVHWKLVLMLGEGVRKIHAHIHQDEPLVHHPTNIQSVYIGTSRWNMTVDIDRQQIILAEELDWQNDTLKREVQYVFDAADCEYWSICKPGLSKNGKETN